MTSERALRQARPRLRVDLADAGILDPDCGAATASFRQKAIAQAVAQLRSGRDLRAAGDPVIARAGMLRVDQKREGAAPADLVAVANAEHALRIRRPVDPVVGEVPAIGGLADRRQDVFELDASLGVIAEARDAVAALRTRRRLGIRLGKLLRGCTQLTAPIIPRFLYRSAFWRLAYWPTPYATRLKKA